MSKGLLISFEGLDGAGKTTQIELLERWLQLQNISYVRTREPGGTPLGVELRKLLLNRPDLAITPLAEVYLFQADRTQHFDKEILPALEAGKLVITDRYIDASVAYQGYGRSQDRNFINFIKLLSKRSTKARIPDLTILLDLDPSQVHRRVGVQLPLPFPSDGIHNQNGVREEPNRLDTEAQSFHRRVRDGFLALAKGNRRRIKKINALQSPDEIHQQIVNLVQPFLDDTSKLKVNAGDKSRQKGGAVQKNNTLWTSEESNEELVVNLELGKVQTNLTV